MAKTRPQHIPVGVRFQLQDSKGDKGWVRYVGPVQEKAGKAPRYYVGVEWDQKGRGKGNGEVGGKRYFTCPDKQASFVHPKKVLVGTTLLDAIKSKYAYEVTEEDEKQRFFVAQFDKRAKFALQVELVGQEDIVAKQSRIDELTQIVVNAYLVADVGPPGALKEECKSLRRLDLTNNLLHSWTQVADIGRQLDLLELRISSNNLSPLSAAPDAPAPSLHDLSTFSQCFSGLQQLFLNNVPNAWEHVTSLCAQGHLPELTELHLVNNQISSLALPPSASAGVDDSNTVQGVPQLTCFPSLELLNVSGNELSDWKEVLRLAALPRLQRLLANDNKLPSVWYPADNAAHDAKETKTADDDDNSTAPSSTVPFARLEALSIKNNLIDSWDSISELDRFPSLNWLRFLEGPLVDKHGVGICRAYTIARLRKLQNFNFSAVSKKERQDAEKLYLRHALAAAKGPVVDPLGRESTADAAQMKASTETLQVLEKTFPRATELLHRFGLPIGQAVTVEKGTALSKRLVVLRLFEGDEHVLEPAADAKVVSKKVPKSMTVGKFKLLVQRLLKVKSKEQVLWYRHSKDEPTVALDDDLRQLQDYGVGLAAQGDVVVERNK